MYHAYCSNIGNNNNIKNISNIMAHRTYRNDMPQKQKDKIAFANTGKKLSQQTKQRISQSMQKYWQKLPYKPDTPTDEQQPTPPTNPYED